MMTPIWFVLLSKIRRLCAKVSHKEFGCCDKLFANCKKCKYVLDEVSK